MIFAASPSHPAYRCCWTAQPGPKRLHYDRARCRAVTLIAPARQLEPPLRFMRPGLTYPIAFQAVVIAKKPEWLPSASAHNSLRLADAENALAQGLAGADG
tara:strand:+ start:31083 stop:31385 length:303 start_codon:yes stop_codon:yes gene_type:complete